MAGDVKNSQENSEKITARRTGTVLKMQSLLAVSAGKCL
jgi:hypothetical protein